MILVAHPLPLLFPGELAGRMVTWEGSPEGSVGDPLPQPKQEGNGCKQEPTLPVSRIPCYSHSWPPQELTQIPDSFWLCLGPVTLCWGGELATLTMPVSPLLVPCMLFWGEAPFSAAQGAGDQQGSAMQFSCDFGSKSAGRAGR